MNNSISQADFLNLDRSHPLMNGLVGWWPMQEGAGLTAFDLSGQGNHGTLTNMDQTTDWVVGRNGGASLDLDGSDDFIECGDIEETQGIGQLTLSCWAALTSPLLKDHCLISKDDQSNRSWSLVQLGAAGSVDDNLRFILRTTSTYTIDSADAAWPNDSEWHHAVAVYDGSNGRVYIDGVQSGSDTSATGTINSTSNTVKIGRRSDGFGDTDGKIQDVRIWNRALTATEVRQLYLNPWAPFQQRNQVVVPTITAASIQYIARQIKIQNQRLILK